MINQAPRYINRLAVLGVAVLVSLLTAAGTQAQSIARLNGSSSATTNSDLADNAIRELRRLQQKVIVYRSLGEFEEGRRLAQVPLKTFEQELQQVTNDVEDVLAQIPAGQLRTQIMNALASYRDGVFWWRRADQPRVVNVSALKYDQLNPTPSDSVFSSTIPYTVAIHWRQAARYLARAEELARKP